MTEDKKHLPLRIERMPDGGFTVSDTPTFGDQSRYCAPLFASSSIGEALAFIAGRLDPDALKALQDQQAKAAHEAKVSDSRAFAKAREDFDAKCDCPDCTRERERSKPN